MVNNALCSKNMLDICVDVLTSPYNSKFKTTSVFKRITDDINFLPPLGRYITFNDSRCQGYSNNFIATCNPHARDENFYFSDDNGLTWKYIKYATLSGVDRKGNIIFRYFTGGGWGYYFSPDSLRTMRPLDAGCEKIYFDKNNTYIANIDSNSIIYISKNLGRTWETKDTIAETIKSNNLLPYNSSSFYMSENGNLYFKAYESVVNGHDHLFVSKDLGTSWNAIKAANPYPEAPIINSFFELSNGGILIGTYQGICISNDNGASFKTVCSDFVEKGPGSQVSPYPYKFYEGKNGLVIVSMTSSSALDRGDIGAIYCGFYVSKDYGQTWTKSTYDFSAVAYGLTFCGDYIYTKTRDYSNYRILRSTDGINWEIIFTSSTIVNQNNQDYSPVVSNGKNIFFSCAEEGMFSDLS